MKRSRIVLGLGLAAIAAAFALASCGPELHYPHPGHPQTPAAPVPPPPG